MNNRLVRNGATAIALVLIAAGVYTPRNYVDLVSGAVLLFLAMLP